MSLIHSIKGRAIWRPTVTATATSTMNTSMNTNTNTNTNTSMSISMSTRFGGRRSVCEWPVCFLMQLTVQLCAYVTCVFWGQLSRSCCSQTPLKRRFQVYIRISTVAVDRKTNKRSIVKLNNCRLCLRLWCIMVRGAAVRN